jgi:VWFA-related protein
MAAPLLHAQEAAAAAQQPYRLRTTARIVLLDVVVTDKNGKTVDGLTRDDFTIFENGVPQTLRSFEPPSAHLSPAPGVPIVHSTADLAKIGVAPVTILVMDELNTSFEDMAYARGRLEKYLTAQPEVLTQPTTLLAATNTKFELIHDFTQDRAALLDALHKHFPDFPWKMRRSGANSSGAFERMAQSLNSLEQMAEATRGTPGRKTIIWVGKGFPSVDLTNLDGEQEIKIRDAIKRLTQELLNARITLYTIDPESSLTNGAVISNADDLERFESQNNGVPFQDEINFSTLAPATGGRALFSRNDIDGEIAEGVAQGSHYYTLSYTPTDPSEDVDKYRSIRIRLKDPSLTATTRDGYYYSPTVAPAEEIAAKTPAQQRTELEAEMGKAALSSVAYNGLNLGLEKAPSGQLRLAIPAGDLRWTDTSSGATRAEITVMEVAFSAKGKVLAHSSQELSAQVAGRIQNPAQKALFQLPPVGPPGTARIRVVARDVETGKIGTADLNP